MRIGEIVVVGPSAEDKLAFINAVSSSVEKVSNDISFGRLQVNEELLIHLYGVAFDSQNEGVSLDLISGKVLGFVVLFRWGDAESFRRAQALVDFISSNYDAQMVVAAHVGTHKPRLPIGFDTGIQVDRQGSLTFCDVQDSVSVKKVLLSLVDLIIDQVA